MKSSLLALALPVVLLTGCASGGYYGYDNGPGYYPGYYGGDYYAGGPTVDVGIYGSDRGGYYHHDRDYHHTDSSYHTAVASRGSTRSFHSSGTRVASANVSHTSGHSGSSHAASASASVGHERH